MWSSVRSVKLFWIFEYILKSVLFDFTPSFANFLLWAATPTRKELRQKTTNLQQNQSFSPDDLKLV